MFGFIVFGLSVGAVKMLRVALNGTFSVRKHSFYIYNMDVERALISFLTSYSYKYWYSTVLLLVMR